MWRSPQPARSHRRARRHSPFSVTAPKEQENSLAWLSSSGLPSPPVPPTAQIFPVSGNRGLGTHRRHLQGHVEKGRADRNTPTPEDNAEDATLLPPAPGCQLQNFLAYFYLRPYKQTEKPTKYSKTNNNNKTTHGSTVWNFIPFKD